MSSSRHDGGGIANLRATCAAWLRSRLLHIVFLCLVVVDFLCVVGELSLTLIAHSTCPDEGAIGGRTDSTEAAIEVLGHVSLGIVAVFVVETVAKLMFLGWTYYAHNWLHAFDAVVVVSTFTMSIVLHGQEEREVVGLLIVFRVGYILRIIDSVVMTSEMHYEDTIHRLEHELAACRLQLQAATTATPTPSVFTTDYVKPACSPYDS
ncbi:hypothetical protein H257_14135 [Aphanomyces astaci]|uniref:Voltage-gated hydrogen channel 1 n=1 Tax=Aphanomyces astaci TaxID=112090 RepID=W4FSI7_APHAT|nr:hypothetical protein H257_14135 [Aphanomyces astaci]ETV70480.1 hypothetical protein H257_14135 [Aphanomyces astaci]RHY88052.1 hypothetical protein DYB35_005298 [Aphanomyces astaci]RHZ12594.1 hypothetical protein DYB37_005491 [Aphanomyces astaci]RQM27684.1 hypothetical protein B5M09_000507 [Aphanomyces astaci]|eukprot:XP_009840192.1 hypothetical protein H257_14135 [Aphanomyces astaci]